MAAQPRLREKPEEKQPQEDQDPVGITFQKSKLSGLALSIRLCKLFKFILKVLPMVFPVIQITVSANTTPLTAKDLGNQQCG